MMQAAVNHDFYECKELLILLKGVEEERKAHLWMFLWKFSIFHQKFIKILKKKLIKVTQRQMIVMLMCIANGRVTQTR